MTRWSFNKPHVLGKECPKVYVIITNVATEIHKIMKILEDIKEAVVVTMGFMNTVWVGLEELQEL